VEDEEEEEEEEEQFKRKKRRMLRNEEGQRKKILKRPNYPTDQARSFLIEDFQRSVQRIPFSN
jgi:hypothetical protein